MTTIQSFDASPVLAGLKPFQRDTVEYVHRRFWIDDAPAHRFLVADEVGLGKTLVARGVIAKTIELLLERDVKRIDIVYICSNAEIARQNIARLSVATDQEFVHATRITLLPKLAQQIKDRRINFFAITPGTSFEVASNSYGNAEERALMFRLLERAWKMERKSGPLHAFRGGVRKTADFLRRIERSEQETPDQELDASLRRAFVKAVRAQHELRACYRKIVKALPRSNSVVNSEIAVHRRALMQGLRHVLARVCIEALEPDLIILDEFQRFKHLLAGSSANEGESEETTSAPVELARSLFEYDSPEFTGRARVLMLSATPYRMFSQAGDAPGDNHYEDFIATYQFLAGEQSASTAVVAADSSDSDTNAELAQTSSRANALRTALEEYRSSLISVGSQHARDWRPARDRIEQLLRLFMARTERLGASSDRNGMLTEVHCENLAARADDIVAFREMQALAKATEHPDTTDYWKSAPYLGAFGRGYKLLAEKDALFGGAASNVLRQSRHLHVPSEILRGQKALDPPHARLRWLSKNVESAGLYDLFWLPPSLPYYRLGGVFEHREGTGTKRLVFSAWQMVPRAISSLLSTEAERRHFGERVGDDLNESSRGLSEPLVFSMNGGKPERMSLLALLYPSFALAELGDPLHQAKAGVSHLAHLEVRAQVAKTIAEALSHVPSAGTRRGPIDQRWYWAAPLLLDAHRDAKATREWLLRSDDAAPWRLFVKAREGKKPALSDPGAAVHFEEFSRMLSDSGRQLGRQPSDLAEVLADIALGGPAVCALRALCRGGARGMARRINARDSAARVAQGFRSFFNTPAIVASLRRSEDEAAYWRAVAVYGREGCLQSVLDEWFHMLPSEHGVWSVRHEDSGLLKIAEAAQDALGLRAATVEANDKPRSETRESESIRFTTRFAVRLADQKSKDGDDQMRSSHVRAAFNAPFWPFVLVSTSVGQEGLDFHTYCHAVVHWNLPFNPVDLEQREGRVHRFKNHAVRRNAASLFGATVLAASPADPWTALFAKAVDELGDGNGVVPYWVLPCEGGAQIERHVPNLPLSREVDALNRLRRDLGLYRMVFGQPRQDELLKVLSGRMNLEELRKELDAFKIDLVPRQSSVPSVQTGS